MFAFITPTRRRDVYDRIALPSIRSVAEPDSIVLCRVGDGWMQTRANAMLQELRAVEGLEGAIFLHDDMQLTALALLDILRAEFADPDVAIIGVIGSRGATRLPWWDVEETFGTIEVPVLGGDGFWRGRHPTGRHEVHNIDGCLVVLSPWAVRNLLFDEAFGPHYHGWDADLCAQARAVGRKVIVTDLGGAHLAQGVFRGSSDKESYVRAELLFQRKWGAARPIRPRPEQLLPPGHRR